MTQTMPTHVSVIVPTRDRNDLLREALASVRALEGPDLRLEIIIANDALPGDPSSGETHAIGRDFGARVVEVGGRGPAAARNAGLREVTGDFFAFLDDDDLWLPGHIRPHLALFAADPTLATVIGQVVNTDEDRTPISEPWPPDFPPNGDALPVLFRWVVQIGAFVSRTSIRQSVGYFDEYLPEAYDWDLYFRIALAHRVGFVPEPSVLFRQRRVAPGPFDAVQVALNRDNSRLFLRAARRAGRRRPPIDQLARNYLHHRGVYYWHFLEVARQCAEARDRMGTRRNLATAFQISPLHWANDLRRPSPLRSAVQSLLVAQPSGTVSRDT